MSTDATEALLKLVADDEQRRCRDLVARAESEAQTMLREAWRAARGRVRTNVQALKQERRQALALAAAELDTARRQHQQRSDQALLEAGREPLRAALAARWRDAAACRLWTDGLLRRALARLPHGSWRIEHPSDWPPAERSRVVDLLAASLGQPPQLQVAMDIAAGLRVHAETAMLDGTLEGLLADQRAVEALMLSEMSAARSPG
jgi:hypothetical protein